MAQRLPADFWKFWAGQTISNLGGSVTMFAVPLLVYKLTGSALNLAIAAAMTNLPYLLFGLLIGAYVDRVNRKRLMIVVDLLRMVVIGTIPLFAVLGVLHVWWIYAVGFLTSTLSIFFDAGEFAAIPSLVNRDNLIVANGRIQASYSAASVAGPLLAGLALAAIPLTAVFLIDASSFAVSALSLAVIGASFNVAGEERQPRHILRDVSEGLRYVLGHPVLRMISAMMALVNFVDSTAWAQVVLFSKQRLSATDSQVGLLFSAGSFGVVILGLLAGQFRKRWSFSTVALGSLMASGVLLIVFALMRSFWLALPVWAAIGGLGILFNIQTSSLRQAIVPNYLLGRIMSIASVLAWSAIPLGSLLGGIVIERTHDLVIVYGGIGALTVLIPVIFSFTPLGHADRYLPPEASASPQTA